MYNNEGLGNGPNPSVELIPYESLYRPVNACNDGNGDLASKKCSLDRVLLHTRKRDPTGPLIIDDRYADLAPFRRRAATPFRITEKARRVAILGGR